MAKIKNLRVIVNSEVFDALDGDDLVASVEIDVNPYSFQGLWDVTVKMALKPEDAQRFTLASRVADQVIGVVIDNQAMLSFTTVRRPRISISGSNLLKHIDVVVRYKARDLRMPLNT